MHKTRNLGGSIAAWLAIVLISMSAGATLASEKSKQDAVTAATFLINLAYQCSNHLGDQALSDAIAVSAPTIEAGGYDPDEAAAVGAQLVESIKSSAPVEPRAPEAMCKAMFKNITDGRPALRDRLKAEG